jgi:hypothetical protein
MAPNIWRWSARVVVLSGVLAGAPLVRADPPTRAARVDYLQGSVSFRPASLDDWSEAILNYPLTTGDHLWTETESWAELHVGSTALRLAPRTAFAFLNLDDRLTQVRLSEGSIDLRVRHLDEADGVEIDTPTAAVAVTRPGTYRVDVLPDGGRTRVIVRSGWAQVSSDGPSFSVSDGQAATIDGDDGAHQILRAEPADAWELWCRARDEHEDQALSPQYVSSEMTGYEDLDDWGTWVAMPEYGWVWRPRVVVAGWAPYRYGRWRWVAPWGWSWVDEAVWGFAPFHYGRWAWVGGTWVWVPGTYVARPIYAPALVAFVGGGGWGLSFSVGAGVGPLAPIGWFPLAPGEPWFPHYSASRTYIRNVNAANVDITRVNLATYDARQIRFTNRAVAGAVTAVSRESFASSPSAARASYAVDRRVALTGEVLGSSAPFPPTPDSRLAGRATTHRPPDAALARLVVARSVPPPAQSPVHLVSSQTVSRGDRPADLDMQVAEPASPAQPHVTADAPAGAAPRGNAGPTKAAAQTRAAATVHPAPPAALHLQAAPSVKTGGADHKKGGR